MILIADGGSTKVDWILLDGQEVRLKTQTPGLNPSVVKALELEQRLKNNPELQATALDVSKVKFFGAGCGALVNRTTLKQVLESFFLKAKVSIYEDTVGAVRAVTDQPGIVCILGTGSNSCFFDGKEIHHPIPSLGYTLMDEAGANAFGKRLLQDYYYKRMPKDIEASFEAAYHLEVDAVLNHLYHQPHPSVYLAQFSKFIFKRPEEELTQPYFKNVIDEELERFVQNRILTFKDFLNFPVHFVGSIAYFSRPILEEKLKAHDLILGKIVRYPIEGLLTYYKNN